MVNSRTTKATTTSIDTASLSSKAQFLESILAYLPHMVFVKEAKELRFVLFNKAGEDLLGIRNEELLGKNDYDFFPKEQADHFVLNDRKVLLGKKMVVANDEAIDSPKLGRRYLRTKKVPIIDENGEAIFLLGISEDITEIKLNQQTIEEQRQALVLSSKLSSLGEMAGGIAHEINNPLSIVQGLSSRLRYLNRERILTEAAVTDITTRLDATVKRVAHIITTMRGIARDGSKDPMTEIELGALIRDNLGLCSEKFHRNSVRVIFDIDTCKGVLVRGRSTEISQVLLNLLQNSYDAVQGLPEMWINIAVKQVNGRAQIRVTDAGSGIPAKVREKMMQPFFTTKEVGKGTGLGLSISKAIVEAHGGKLQLDPSGPNTCFTFDLEIAKANVQAA